MARTRTIIAGATLAAFVAACGGGSAASLTPPPDADLTIDARDMAFDREELRIPAGTPIGLFFRNLDGAPHNVAIYADASAADPIWVGETITDAAVTYELPAQEAGTTYFRCDVHPDMDGIVVVEAG